MNGVPKSILNWAPIPPTPSPTSDPPEVAVLLPEWRLELLKLKTRGRFLSHKFLSETACIKDN